MNPEKSEVKLSVLQSHGEKTEQKMEQCRLESIATEAALQVLSMTTKEFHKYMGDIELETRTGNLSPAHAVVARKYVKKCLDLVEGFFKGTEMKFHQSKGKAEAYKDIVESLKNDRDEERKKLEGFKEAQQRALDEQIPIDAEGFGDADPEPDVRSRKSRPIRMDVARSLGIDNKKRK